MDKKKLPYLKRIFKKKRTWIILGIVVILLSYFIFRPKDNSKNIVSDFVKYANLSQTVLATGQVTSDTDLNLSFNSSGIVRTLNVSVGDKVYAGQVLATIDQGAQLAALTQARGALAAAQARLQKTLDGASNEDIRLAQVNLDQTKLTQDILVKNAYKNLLNSTPQAVPEGGVSDYTAPTISGTYNGDQEGTIKVNVYATGSGSSFSVSGLASGSGVVTTTTPQPLGNSGLYIKFPSLTNNNVSSWVIILPNKQAPDYLVNKNAYETALSQAQLSISQLQATLDLKKAQARQPDIDLAKADIVTAEGQVQAAQAKYDDTIIRAPVSGTITSVDIKLGELATALNEAIVLQDVSNMYLETNINEANIASVKVGMPVDVNFDAFGTDKNFKGTVVKIDPSSTLISGVVNYKLDASIEKIPGLKPGMTANMTIKVQSKDHVLVVPSRAILTDKNNKETVRLITNTKTKAYKEVPVTTGLVGDGGMVEVTSGLSDGEEIVVLVKS
ncbi:MAG: efflux RND transporter periplasmic adaptor subunit [Patescibacteria group bacterium]|nr:efflux RND transporter periplasmic adaptor subunit [Patescibacteria group bacterium]